MAGLQDEGEPQVSGEARGRAEAGRADWAEAEGLLDPVGTQARRVPTRVRGAAVTPESPAPLALGESHPPTVRLAHSVASAHHRQPPVPENPGARPVSSQAVVPVVTRPTTSSKRCSRACMPTAMTSA